MAPNAQTLKLQTAKRFSPFENATNVKLVSKNMEVLKALLPKQLSSCFMMPLATIYVCIITLIFQTVALDLDVYAVDMLACLPSVALSYLCQKHFGFRPLAVE